MFVVHDSRFSPLNFCSSESIVKAVEPKDMTDRSRSVVRLECSRIGARLVSVGVVGGVRQ